MAIKTDNTEDQRNPSARDYEESFNKSLNTPNTPTDLAAQDQRDTAMRNAGASSSVANAEKQAIGDTAAGKAAMAAAGTVTGPIGNAITKFVGKIKTKKGGAVAGGIAGLLLIGILLTLLAPSAILLNLKENGHRFMTRVSNIGMDKRVRDVMEKRYFADPEGCKGVKIKCRFTPGMSDAEIKKLIDNGMIKDTDVGTKNGKKYLKQMTYTADGKTTIITKNEFRSAYASNRAFSSSLRNVVDGRGVLSRGVGALKKYSLFGVDRKSPLGEGGDEKTRLQKFRESFYGEKKNVTIKPGVTDDNTDGLAADKKNAIIGGLDNADVITAEANKISQNAVINGPGTVIPDTSILATTDPSKIAVEVGTSTVKSSILGFFSVLDSSCAVYNVMRITMFAAKVYTAAALIKYAGLFMTVADKQKDSDATAAEIGLLASALVRPSTAPGSKGKDFSQSQGASLLFNGKISQPESLARYSVGTTAMGALRSAYSIFNFNGNTANVCSKVNSWWGASLMIVGGLVTSIATLGTGAIFGSVIGATKALAFAYIQQVLIAKLVPVIAGTVAPDLKTDPEGGYGIGNALAAGIGAMGAEQGKAVGMRPLTEAQVTTLASTNTARRIAADDTYSDSKRGIFDSDNPNSIQNTLAIAMVPVASSTSSITDIFSNVTSVISSAFRSPFQAAYAADQTLLGSYGGKYCAEKTDDVLIADASVRELARDANCNLIYGADAPTISDTTTQDGGAYSVDRVVDYMLTNGYIDTDGNATDTGGTTESYKQFIDSCVDGTDPIIDQYSADLGGSENPALCYRSGDAKVDYYRVYTQLVGAAGGVDDAANDKLGFADASSAAGKATIDTTPADQTTTGGMAWPIKKANWPNRPDPILNCSLIYETVRSRAGDVHTGIDMMAPYGTPIYAAADGKVTMVSSGWGAINIQTNLKDGTDTLYLNYQHMSQTLVSMNQQVFKDKTLVGYVGFTGSPPKSNSHLHFGVWTTNGFLSGQYPPDDPRAARTLDRMRHPMNYLPADGRNTNSCKKPYVVP